MDGPYQSFVVVKTPPPSKNTISQQSQFTVANTNAFASTFCHTDSLLQQTHNQKLVD